MDQIPGASVDFSDNGPRRVVEVANGAAFPQELRVGANAKVFAGDAAYAGIQTENLGGSISITATATYLDPRFFLTGRPGMEVDGYCGMFAPYYAKAPAADFPGLGTWSCVGAYATVTAPGRVAVGDPVRFSAA